MSDHLLKIIVSQVWQIALLTAVVAFITRIFAKNRPHLAHALWILVLVKCLTPPVFGHSLSPFSQLQAMWLSTDATKDTMPVSKAVPPKADDQTQAVLSTALLTIPSKKQTHATDLPGHSARLTTSGTAPTGNLTEIAMTELAASSHNRSGKASLNPVRSGMLLTIAAIGATITLITIVVRYIRCLRLINQHRTTEFDDRLQQHVQNLSERLRLRRAPRVIVSSVQFGPAVLGLIRQTIVLPRCLLELPNDEVQPGRQDLRFLDPILAHELLHIRRGDLRTGALQIVARSLWWFHPAVWLCNRWLSREAERCCDEQVIAELGCSPAQYARSLLSVIETKHRLQPVPVFPGMKPVEITSQRMEQIMSLKGNLRKQTPMWCWLATAILAVFVLPGAEAQITIDDESAAIELSVVETKTAHAHGFLAVPGTVARDPSTIPHDFAEAKDPLVQLAWKARESVRRRLLSTDQHTPWQIMRGVEALRWDMTIRHNGSKIRTLEWIQSGPSYQGEPWFQKTLHGGKAHSYVKPYWFEGPINQFTACLASCRVPLTTQFETPDGPILMRDLIVNAQMTVNDTDVVSWTLIALCHYLPPDATWTNQNGEKWSIERLVEIEAAKRVNSHEVANGGTDGLYALTFARNEYIRSGKSLDGAWLKADEKIRRYIEVARSQQNPDGMLSSAFFRGRQSEPRFDRRLASTSHLLHFLVNAVTEEQLSETWVRSAVEATASDMLNHSGQFVSFDPLYTATSALTTYLERVTKTPIGLNCAIQANEPQQHPHTSLSANSALDNANQTSSAAVPESPFVSSCYYVADLIVPIGSTQANVDYLPIIELIKSSIEPDSWNNGAGQITFAEPTLSLVIRQTTEVHQQIAQLLSQLRNDQTQIQISAQILKITTDSQLQGLRSRCSLHPQTSSASTRKPEQQPHWALLTPDRSEQLLKFLNDEKAEPVSRPKILTISDQSAFVEVGSNNAGQFHRYRLDVKPHLVTGSSLIRLSHSVQFGDTDLQRQTGGELSLEESLDKRISLHFHEAPLTEVMRHVATTHNVNITFKSRVLSTDSLPATQRVSIDVDGVTLREALKVLLEQAGELSFSIENHVLVISDQPKQEAAPTMSSGAPISESLMSSGQTLLLLIEPALQSATDETPQPAPVRFVILLTAEVLREQESNLNSTPGN